jgi:hypothetical protein
MDARLIAISDGHGRAGALRQYQPEHHGKPPAVEPAGPETIDVIDVKDAGSTLS